MPFLGLFGERFPICVRSNKHRLRLVETNADISGIIIQYISVIFTAEPLITNCSPLGVIDQNRQNSRIEKKNISRSRFSLPRRVKLFKTDKNVMRDFRGIMQIKPGLESEQT